MRSDENSYSFVYKQPQTDEERALCDEAITSSDERVLSLALAIVADQRRTVAQLRRVIDFFEV